MIKGARHKKEKYKDSGIRLTEMSLKCLNDREFINKFCQYWECHEMTYRHWKKQYLQRIEGSEEIGKGVEMLTNRQSLIILLKYRRMDLKDFNVGKVEDLIEKPKKHDKQTNN